MSKAIVGGYTVTWKYAKVIGGKQRIYIGINDADKINAGEMTFETAVRQVIAKSEKIADYTRIELISVK